MLIFTNWAIVYFGKVFLITKVTYIIEIQFPKNGLGYVLGDFFANLSSHPAQK
jgi:hypothetical protein